MNRTGSKILHGLLLATSGLVGSTLIASTAAMAGGGPTGGTVAVGSATIINASPTQTVVNQSSKKALINWNSFSIPGGSSVQFNQPSSKSLTVNRVTGPNASTIDGALLANGNVWLINANGILFGKGSQINVGALLATTSDLSDDDFKAGKYNFKPATNPNAAVVNKGTITAGTNGSVILSAPRVSNEGLIDANLGTVVLGGAKAFTVDMTGDNLLRYQITAPVTNAPKDANGSVAAALVSNSGTIEAAGGHVMMTARAARNVEDNVINNSGMVEATSVSSHNGEIDLDAGPNGTVNDSGTLNATGSAQGQIGGTVNVTGGTVNIADGAKINASGNAGGGTVQIGGGLHGQGDLAHAQRTIIGNATISADATNKGNGGTVAVWSDGDTSVSGTITASGGAKGGNGGQVETSGQNLGIAASTKVDTSAPLGLSGDWLLDPNVINIQSGGGDGVNSTNSTAYIDPTAIISALGSGNVTLETTLPNCGTGAIVVNSTINYTSNHTLSLLSQGYIEVDASIQNNGTGALNLVAGWDGVTTNFSGNFPSTAYGQNSGGTVTLVGASVGSAGGKTTVAGYGVTVEGAPGSGAAIGYWTGPGGDISVLSKTSVVLDGSLSVAQIGNYGGSANISVVAAGDVSLTGGEGYAQIGNGGEEAGASGGNVAVKAGGNIDLQADTFWGSGYVQIGNGGLYAGDAAGNISVSAAGNVTLQGGIAQAYAQIGNAGEDAGSGSGAISVTANGTLSLASDQNYAQIGNGGDVVTDPSAAGNITIAAGNLTLTDSQASYVQIGNGGPGFLGNVSGDIAIKVANQTTLTNDFNGVWIGNYTTNGTSIGNVSIITKSGYIAGDFLAADLQGGDLLLGWTGGNIQWQGLEYNSPHTLSILAAGNIDVAGSTENSGSGAINFVAGWDGATTNPSSFANSGVYGNHTGNVTIDGRSTDVSVGSKGGATTVLGYDVDLTSGAGHAQIGFNGAGATGAINVRAVHNVVLAGGNALNTSCVGCGPASAYAQIGHGGAFVVGSDGGNISVQAGGNITVAGGQNTFDYAQIGNGGDADIAGSGAASDTGNINIIAGGAISVAGGTDYAQIGNGGWGSNGSSGAISISANGNITLAGANNSPWGYAQIGNGGQFSLGPARGNIAITTNGTLSLTAGNNGMYAQVGNGGDENSTAVSGIGNITITAANLALAGASSTGTGEGYALIGNSAIFDVATSGSGVASGNISINVSGATTIQSTAGQGDAWIGNGASLGGSETGSLTLITGDLSDSGDNNDDIGQFVLSDLSGGAVTVGITDANSTNKIDVNLDYNSSNALTILSAGNLTIAGDIQNAGTGNITIVTGWNPAVAAANVLTTAGSYGNGGKVLTVGGALASGDVDVGSQGGVTNILAGTLLVSAENGYAQIGYHGLSTSAINVATRGDIAIQATGDGFSAQIGNGDATTVGSIGGNISIITNGGSLVLAALADDSVAAIGNIAGTGGSESGNIAIDTKSGALALSSTGSGSYAQIGNWANGSTTGTSSGNITISAGDIAMSTDGVQAAATIGNGNRNVGVDTGDLSGDIAINATTLTMSADASGVNFDQTRIGNLGDGAVSGNITIATTGDVLLSGLHGGLANIGNLSTPTDAGGNPVQGEGTGDINIQAGGSVSLLANGGAARIETGGAISGNVSVTAAGNITLAADNPSNTGEVGTAFIGALTVGDGTVNVAVKSTNGRIVLDAADAGSLAAIGNIENGSVGTIGGNVTVTASHAGTGDIIVSSTGAGSQARIGNSGNGPGTSGEIAVLAGDALTIVGGNSTANNGSLALIGNTNVLSGGAASGNVTVTANSVSGIGRSIANDLPGGDFTLNSLGNGTLVVDSGGTYDSTHNLTVNAGGSVLFEASLQNAGSGNITFVSAGDVTIGGSGASGGVAVGSKGGITTIVADSLLLSAVNGYAQLGYHGGGSGAIIATIAGNVTLSAGGGTGDYAQIGDGGYQVSGSSSEDISVIAGGNILLNAGAGQEAYAQIGNGGAESNSNSSGYSETGLITVAANTVTLDAGTGTGSYVQVGHGGYKSGQSLNGIATIGGDIVIDAVTAVRLVGGGDEAYAQIGNGGDFVNNNAANGSGGTISGDIEVAVAAPNTGADPLTMTAGTGLDSYTQIGNGGQGENTPVKGATVTFNVSGNVTVADLVVTGSNSGINGYAQVGNGDISKTGTANVSGLITLGYGTDLTTQPGTAHGANAGLGNATGFGTVSGTIFKDNSNNSGGSVAYIIQNPVSPTYVVTIGEQASLPTPGESDDGSGPTPLDQLSGDANAEGQVASDGVARSVGQSLGEGKGIYVTSKTLIPGVLKQIVTLTPNNPHGVPPADVDYSSWGNEALWRW